MENDGMRYPEVAHDWFDDDAVNLAKACDGLEAYRAAIAALLAEIEDLISRQNPRIEAEWQIVVGVWENKLLEAQIAARRARRRCSLFQAQVNKGEPVDIQKVERALDNELAEWTSRLEGAVERYQSAVTSHESALHISTGEAGEHKRLYRILAKRLHPDLHPDLDESAKAMFSLAQTAYRQCDLKMLQSLEASTAHLETDAAKPTTVEDAQRQMGLLKDLLGSLNQRIELIKRDQPYCLRAKLEDAAWVEAHIAQLKKEIRDCEQTQAEYLKRCEEIERENG